MIGSDPDRSSPLGEAHRSAAHDFWAVVDRRAEDPREARLEVERGTGADAEGHDEVMARCGSRETYAEAVAALLAVRSDPAALAWLGAGVVEDACHDWGAWALQELRRVGMPADVVAQLREHAWWDDGAPAASDGARRGEG